MTRRNAIAYRDDGTIGKSGGSKVIRKLAKQESVVAVDGPFVWTWRESPPDQVAQALRELCSDVPHLGTAESPVLLSICERDEKEFAPTHAHAADAGPFDSTPGIDLDVPLAGRVDELTAAHRAERTAKVTSDRAGTDERSASSIPARRAIRSARYRALADTTDEPWTQVLLLPLDEVVPERDRVRWAVAVHKSMIKILDRESPPLLTGSYPDGVRRPSNRLALHFVDRSMPVDLPGGVPAALAIMLPPDATAAELDAIYRAVGQLRNLHLRRRGAAAEVRRILGAAEVVAGDRFWREPGPGSIRLWRTCPAAVPDTRGYEGWTFAHAALLSVGFVRLGRGVSRPASRGAKRDAAIVDAVNAAGAAVLSVAPVRNSRIGDHVHHVNTHAVVRPYQATLTLGDLGGARAVQAIGQSRHLGGGLLLPIDQPESVPV